MLRFLVQWFFIGLLLVLTVSAFAEGSKMDNARSNILKAGMVNGFTSYTSWPDADDSRPFVIGVMGQDKLFIPALKRFFAKKPVFSQRVINIRAVNINEIHRCQVLVVLGEANSQANEIIARVLNLPILTISDRENFALSGGHVNFYSDNNKLRFEVNWQSTTRSKLKVSSRLLRLARVIGKDK